MLNIILVFVSALLSPTYANKCTDVLNGTCNSLSSISDACAAGEVYSLSYCGFLQICCYKPQTSTPLVIRPVTHPVITTTHTAITSNSSCGITMVGATSHKIVGGSLAQYGEFPWQVSLRYYNQHVCGGTLVGDQWVMTAANCFDEYGTPWSVPWSVGIGIQDQQRIYQSNLVHVTAIYLHSKFDSSSHRNDIALMKLSKRVDIHGMYTRTACLPHPTDTYDSDVCTVSGWGSTYYDPYGRAPMTRQLHYVNMRTITNDLCRYYLGTNNIWTTNICADTSSTGGKDACQVVYFREHQQS